MINLKSWKNWNESLSKEEVVKGYDKFGSTAQVPEIVHFGFNKIRNSSISPFSGNFRKMAFYDWFEGHAISVTGNSYLKGILDKEKGVLRMIEFYEVLYSRGDWCEYNIDLNKEGNEKGEYRHVRQGKDFDFGKVEIISLDNMFSLDKGVDDVGYYSMVFGGLKPKKLTEFWNNLKEEGFDVPPQYYSKEERNDFEEDSGIIF